MTQQQLVRSCSFALLLVACSGSWAGQLSAQTEGVAVSYSLESPAVTMHEPVIVRVDVVNRSTQPMTVRLGRDRKENFSFVIQPPDGSTQRRPPLPRREGAFALGNVSLGPGESLHHRLLLNEWATLSTPGVYELEVRLLTPIEMSSGTKVGSKPYHTSFKVLPRDEAQLSAACARLVQQIESTDSAREAMDAAAALGYIEDPVAVPYLERALRSSKPIYGPITDGLAKVGSESAARILIAAVRESPAWPPNVDTMPGSRAIFARRALQMIAASTSNEHLRQDIQRTIP